MHGANFFQGGLLFFFSMTDRADLRSVDYRPKERTWATPARVFPGDLLVSIHCELGLCEFGPWRETLFWLGAGCSPQT
jgi:hypothetical protein